MVSLRAEHKSYFWGTGTCTGLTRVGFGSGRVKCNGHEGGSGRGGFFESHLNPVNGSGRVSVRQGGTRGLTRGCP